MKSDRGSAVAAFVLVSPLVVMLGLAALQIITVTLIRNNATSIAFEAARHGAAWDSSVQDAEARARQLMSDQLSAAVRPRVAARELRVGNLGAVEVRITLSPRAVGPLPTDDITVSAVVVDEKS